MVHTPRRILFVSGFFPPFAPIGAVRSGKLEQHWKRLGHDVRTIAIALPSTEGPCQHPQPSIHYISYREPGHAITAAKTRIVQSPIGSLLIGGSRRSEPNAANALSPPSNAGVPIGKLGLIDFYREAQKFPDRYKSWIGDAVRLAMSWSDSWKPDVIYSSGPPHSGHIVASRLASRLGVKWLAEFRDLWADDPYYDRHRLIRLMLHRLAKATLSCAAGFVVVTEAAGKRLLTTTSKPVLVSYNGFDPEDFAGLEEVEPLDRGRLTIVHAGIIYLGRRDPSPLFRAIAMLGEQSGRIRVLFYHDASGSVATLAKNHGIVPSVEIHDAIPRPQVLRVERQADILLECRWQDPAGDGVIPGKLFEYIGARRPILSVGSLTGESAHIVRDNHLGLVSNDPHEIEDMLRNCLEVKAQLGRLPDIESAVDDRFHRETQFRKIDDLIEVILQSRSGPS